MKEDCKLVYEVWDLFSDQVPPARRLESAISLLRLFEEQMGSDSDSLSEILDENDPYLTRAFHEVFPDEGGYDDEGDDEE